MGIHENEVIGQVRHAMALDPQLDAPRINISMIGESLALIGVLDTAEQVAHAAEVARAAAPGITIDNGLTVSETTDGGSAYGLPGKTRHPD